MHAARAGPLAPAGRSAVHRMPHEAATPRLGAVACIRFAHRYEMSSPFGCSCRPATGARSGPAASERESAGRGTGRGTSRRGRDSRDPRARRTKADLHLDTCTWLAWRMRMYSPFHHKPHKKTYSRCAAGIPTKRAPDPRREAPIHRKAVGERRELTLGLASDAVRAGGSGLALVRRASRGVRPAEGVHAARAQARAAADAPTRERVCDAERVGDERRLEMPPTAMGLVSSAAPVSGAPEAGEEGSGKLPDTKPVDSQCVTTAVREPPRTAPTVVVVSARREREAADAVGRLSSHGARVQRAHHARRKGRRLAADGQVKSRAPCRNGEAMSGVTTNRSKVMRRTRRARGRWRRRGHRAPHGARRRRLGRRRAQPLAASASSSFKRRKRHRVRLSARARHARLAASVAAGELRLPSRARLRALNG